MPPLSVLIKPASSLCDLKCRYCFYRDEAGLREKSDFGIMTPKVSSALCARIAEDAEGEVFVTFQGGEPTLAGIEYFENFADRLDKALRERGKNIRVNYCLQTNGLRLDKEFRSFLKRRNFLVGVSLDGTAEIHNFFRGGYGKTVNNIAGLVKDGIDFNVLTVVTREVARRPEKVYAAYKKAGYRFLQFIPCLQPMGDGESFSPGEEEYGEFLVKTFGLYLNDLNSGSPVSVRLFDNLLNVIRGFPAELCSSTGRCSLQNVVEADGSVYPCDFYCLDEYRQGNVTDSTFAELNRGEAARKFLLARSRPEECEHCGFGRLCGYGGCVRERVGAPGNKTKYCLSYKALFGFMERALGVRISRR